MTCRLVRREAGKAQRSGRIKWSKQDHYGRLVGKIWATPPELHCDGRIATCPKTLDVNLAQLTVDLAWHFKKYEMEQSEEDRLGAGCAIRHIGATGPGLSSQSGTGVS